MLRHVAIPRLIINTHIAHHAQLDQLNTNGFTIGKEYPIIQKVGVIGQERLGLVHNDHQEARFVHLNQKPCSQIVIEGSGEVAGYFEIALKNT